MVETMIAPMSKRALIGVAVAVITASIVLFLQQIQRRGEETTPAEPASYVGRQACARCHEQQLDLWRGSHHDLAMQVADETTVLGDFDDATFTHFGVETTFYKSDGKFYARTEGRTASFKTTRSPILSERFPFSNICSPFPTAATRR